MNVLGQSNISNIVNRMGDKLCSSCILSDNTFEISTKLIVDIKNFEIIESFAEIHKSPFENMKKIIQLDEFKGKSGYIEGKKWLKRVLDFENGEVLKVLFNQCINGIIQAETYLIQERGFKSNEEYNRYWDQIEENGCRMYCNKHQDDLEWTEYASPLDRKENLFNRSINSKWFELDDKNIFAVGTFSDSYHELHVNLKMKNHEQIETCEIEYKRAPGKACFENYIHQEKLKGKYLKELDKKTIISMFGKSQGCYHLVDLLLELSRTSKIKWGI